ncbi:MAG: hypothetical protein J7J51_01135, partial [Candidatus Omnitrophica bacterium]|nr:hypothetical protein [Candidatus Omnitrophota bacterium]
AYQMKDYKALPIAVLVLKIFAWISVIAGVIGGISGIVMMFTAVTDGLRLFAVSLLYGGLSFLYLYALSEVIQLLMNLERNTRKE